MPDREERHLLSEDLGSGEPVSRASAQNIKNKLGLSWAKLSSNWNWNIVLLHLRFVA